ncbi:unnamed protein product [Dicrocoelium dendriticum]|nr:unnamed protein product [Dicrocoelium dendriticum]
MDRKRELCAFLGNAAHATGHGKDGLYYREELQFERVVNQTNPEYRSVGSRNSYKMSDKPVLFRKNSIKHGQVRFLAASYHGRGPLQLSWGYNYGDYSKFLYNDPQVLLENPDQLLDKPEVGIGAAIWFWMTQPDWRPEYIPHKMMYKPEDGNSWGFGHTIMAISGGLEYDAKENGKGNRDVLVTRRIDYYRRCAAHFKISVGKNGEKMDTSGLLR